MRAFVAGGAGFIGSHTVDRLLKDPSIEAVTVYDNFSSGKREYLPVSSPRLRVIEGEIGCTDGLSDAMDGHDVVFHFASNPDIARAAQRPDVDFWHGTFLTQRILEAMRHCAVRQLLYASGSGVYGDTGLTYVGEDFGPLLPISTYGASKLACESLICSYCHMFDLQAWVFRFANVVGPRQTHGVVLDFIRKLTNNPARLPILGDGMQSKSYIHVSDVLEAVWSAWQYPSRPYQHFNVATDDYVRVVEIADTVVRIMGLQEVVFDFAGGNRGWKGDVPIVRLDVSKIKAVGWHAKRSSAEAIEESARELLRELEQCRP